MLLYFLHEMPRITIRMFLLAQISAIIIIIIIIIINFLREMCRKKANEAALCTDVSENL
jgi:hypothetical protein